MLQENFEDYLKGKTEENQRIIIKLVESLARDIMAALDTRKKGMLDVSH